MTWGHAAFAAIPAPTDTASPAIYPSNPARGMCGLARITGQTPKSDGWARAEFRQAMQEGVLLARRLALISTVRKLRRDHRATCSAMDDLRAVTMAILAQGER
jgi:hypothetical protein